MWHKMLDLGQIAIRAFEEDSNRTAAQGGDDGESFPLRAWITTAFLYRDEDVLRLKISFQHSFAPHNSEAESRFTMKAPGKAGISTCLSHELMLIAMMPSHLVDSSSMSESSLICAKRWLHECCSSHDKCKGDFKAKSWYPKRLLYVQNPEHEIWNIRVINSTHEQPQGPYLTLSHRWGENETFKLTRDNIALLSREIDMQVMPKTFSDALRVTVALGYQYLWIDSLCIIQDENDLADWSEQAGLMHKIYLHSRCNISASGARNSAEGLSRERDPSSFYGKVVSVQVDGSMSSIAHENYWLEKFHIWTENISHCHLNSRGWVFQERILAPRILHFCNDQMFWECRSHRACERHPKGHKDLSNPSLEFTVSIFKGYLEQQNKEQLRALINRRHISFTSFWMEIMAIYSRTYLTDPADRLIALSGIAKQMSYIVDDIYVAGMWRRGLPCDLLWYRKGSYGKPNSTIPTFNAYIAPSWSWASINLPIDNWSLHSSTILFEIVDVRLQHATEDVMGRVTGGWLKLRGHLKSMSLNLDQDEEEWRASASRFESMPYLFSILLDDPPRDPRTFDDDNAKGRLFYMPAASFVEWDKKKKVVVILFRTVHRESGVFTRLGVAKVLNEKSDDASPVEQSLTKLDEDDGQYFPGLEDQDGKRTITVI